MSKNKVIEILVKEGLNPTKTMVNVSDKNHAKGQYYEIALAKHIKHQTRSLLDGSSDNPEDHYPESSGGRTPKEIIEYHRNGVLKDHFDEIEKHAERDARDFIHHARERGYNIRNPRIIHTGKGFNLKKATGIPTADSPADFVIHSDGNPILGISAKYGKNVSERTSTFKQYIGLLKRGHKGVRPFAHSVLDNLSDDVVDKLENAGHITGKTPREKSTQFRELMKSGPESPEGAMAREVKKKSKLAKVALTHMGKVAFNEMSHEDKIKTLQRLSSSQKNEGMIDFRVHRNPKSLDKASVTIPSESLEHDLTRAKSFEATRVPRSQTIRLVAHFHDGTKKVLHRIGTKSNNPYPGSNIEFNTKSGKSSRKFVQRRKKSYLNNEPQIQ